MKSIRVAVCLLILLVSFHTVMAQALTETTTIGTITLSYPAAYTPHDLGDGSVALIDPQESYGLVILNEPLRERIAIPRGMTAREAISTLQQIDDSAQQPEFFSLANGDGGVIPLDIVDYSDGRVYAVDTEDGLLMAYSVAYAGETPVKVRDVFLAVLGSVTFESGYTAPESTSDDCSTPVEDFPANSVHFCYDVQISIPKNWRLISGLESVSDYGVIHRGYDGNISTKVSEITPEYNPLDDAEVIVASYAHSEGHEDFDFSQHMVMLVDEPGRTITYYDPAEYVTLDESEEVHTIMYVVVLDERVVVTHTGIFTRNTGEPIPDEIEAIVLSTLLTDGS